MKKPDLTRWNRAGLKRFRYVDGNAATYLEALRQELFARLIGWDIELLGIKRDSDDPKKALDNYVEQFGKDHQQALSNYLNLNDKRAGIALEIIRSFARAAHVLTEHLDAYANEGFLGTATQWENVRRLVYGLDYHPRPPASATTHLVLRAKPEQKGLIPCGLQIKHTPEGESPVVFETLEDLQVDSAFNDLRLKDWNRSPEKVKAVNDQLLTLDCIVDGLKRGDPVIIENQEEGWLLPCLLENTDVEGESTVLNLNLPPRQDLGCRGDVLIHLKPAERLEVFSPTRSLTYQGVIPLVIRLKEEQSMVALQEAFQKAQKDNQEFIVFIGNKKGEAYEGAYKTVLKVEGGEVILASAGADQELIENAEFLSLTHTLVAHNNEANIYLPGDLTALNGSTVLVNIGSKHFSNTYRQGSITVISTHSGSSGKDSQVQFMFGFLPDMLKVSYRVDDGAAVCIPSTAEEMRWEIEHIEEPVDAFFHPGENQTNISLVLLPTPFERLAQTEISTLMLQEEPIGLQEELEQARINNRDLVLFIGKGNVGIYRKLIKINGKQLILSSTVADENLQIELNDVSIAGEIYASSDRPGCITLEKDMTKKPWLPLSQGRPVLEESAESIRKRLDGASVFMRWLNEGFHLIYRETQLKDAQPKLSKPDDKPDDKPSIFKVILGSEQFQWPDSRFFNVFIPPGPNQDKWKVDSYVEHSNTLWQTNTVKRTGRDDLCVAACGSTLMAACVQNITEEGAGRSGLHVDNWQPSAFAERSEKFLRSQTTVFGKFKEQVRLKDWDVNETKISDKKQTTRTLTLENKEAAENLKQGQLIVIEQEASEPRQCFLAKVQSVSVTKETAAVRLESDLPAEHTYTAGGTVIHANVVLAGHGEAQPEKILGSGNATLSSQEFLFPVSNISFVSDDAQVSGVRADIRVMVDGEIWMQVSRFNQSQPTDPHYVVRMTEGGHLRIVFGDGVNGRRLPTGENNVRIAWRLGSGKAGNLDAESLKKPAHPHPRVEAIIQPFACVGGNDMESVTSLRRSAPASLLTMERAVSVNDFAELAASHSSVWSARAELKSSGKERAVRVIVIPAHGGELSSDLAEKLKTFLLSRAIPGVELELERFQSEPLKLNITLGINKARFNSDVVMEEVREILLQRFALENRTIGAPVYLSDIYQCVEAVSGVEYSVCKFGDSNKQFLYPLAHEGVLNMEDKESIIHLSLGEVQE